MQAAYYHKDDLGQAGFRPCISQSPTVDRIMVTDSLQFSPGSSRLQEPILPLVRLIHLLFLTGPFETIKALIDELPEEIEQGTIVYRNPVKILSPYLDLLEDLRGSKYPTDISHLIINQQGEQVDTMEGIEAWVCQRILSRELAEINSLLCHPCGCALCCVGPEEKMTQEYFEIPLTSEEIGLFQLERIDTNKSRGTIADTEPPFIPKKQPFYAGAPALYNWKNGWSLILSRQTHCPHLTLENNSCQIYPNRPDTCRRPQIFPYLLERRPDLDKQQNNRTKPVYVLRNMLLAIWDCPYVRRNKDQIASYAESCLLEPIFKSNKA